MEHKTGYSFNDHREGDFLDSLLTRINEALGNTAWSDSANQPGTYRHSSLQVCLSHPLRCSRAAKTSAWSWQVHHMTCGALELFLQQKLDTAGNLQGHLDAHIWPCKPLFWCFSQSSSLGSTAKYNGFPTAIQEPCCRKDECWPRQLASVHHGGCGGP